MPTLAIRIKQTYETERVIEVNVDTDHHDVEDALKELRAGFLRVPEFGDPRWRTEWQLLSERIEPVCAPRSNRAPPRS